MSNSIGVVASKLLSISFASFFARHNLTIHGSHIETKCIFNVVGVLTSLHHYHPGLSNMNGLVIIYKNSSDDASTHCESAPNNVQEFFE